MTIEAAVEFFEREWDSDGFLDRVRRGDFEPHEGAVFLSKIAELRLPDEVLIPKRFVSFVWYLPLFLEWQKERVAEVSKNAGEYEKFVTSIQNALEHVLGGP